MILFNKKYYREQVLSMSACIVATLLLYYFLLDDPLTTYNKTINQRTLILNELNNDRLLQRKDIPIQKQLQLINDKNNMLYMAAQTINNADQLSLTLSTLIETTGFTIKSIQSLTPNQTVHFQVTAKGNYFSLFRLLEALKENAWPMTLFALQIEKKDTYHLDFETTGLS